MVKKRVFMERKIRVLLAKPGLDGHDRGIKVIASALRDAGFEVIYTGLRQTPEMIVEAAIQEDVDAIGMSILSGAHMTLFPAVLNLLKEKNADHILLFGGGIIPKEDVEKLEKMGVGMLFTPGAATTEAIEYLKNEIPKRRKEEKIF
jgi:methylmalonyl-CoA mutase C-terminal domain/subunit